MKVAYDYCERVAEECRQQTGEWIYGRLVEAAKRAAESGKDFPDDIPDAVDTEFDYFMSEWMEKSGIAPVVEKEGGRGQWQKASMTASKRRKNY